MNCDDRPVESLSGDLPQHLSGDAVAALTVLAERLRDSAAPTAVHDPRGIRDIHLRDALVGLDLPEVRGAATLADLGTGAGIPGLVLAAALPDTRVFLVESVGKKCVWVADTAAAMGLANVEVVCLRTEEWRDGLNACDVVTARALAPLAVLCEYAAPLLVPGGALVCWKAALDTEEIVDAATAAAVLGMSGPETIRVQPYEAVRDRQLVVLRKVGPTPQGFPRRPGMATKRPITATSSQRIRSDSR
jgi:16S rRNA (guanine527-N7)-methyltransferase